MAHSTATTTTTQQRCPFASMAASMPAHCAALLRLRGHPGKGSSSSSLSSHADKGHVLSSPLPARKLMGAAATAAETSTLPSHSGRVQGTVIMPPEQAPAFSIKELRAAIPAHCFERSMLTSSLYILADVAKAMFLFTAAGYIGHPSVPVWARCVLWPAYWAAQGLVLMGLWVLAHECGHQTFSRYRTANDAVGLLLHSFLLVPYHPWRISHSNHHKHTCNLEHDEVFVPVTRSMAKEMVAETPFYALMHLLLTLLVGWPLYLITNATGPAKHRGKGKRRSHCHPGSALFQARDRNGVVLSVVAVAAMGALLVALALQYSLSAVVFYYGIPYLIVNHYLIIITFLQHSDEFVPHYRPAKFQWLRGALATVDRSWGWLVDAQLHHISDTHVAHHLFSTLPHYHAQEATLALRRVLGRYYLRDETPIWTALWRSWNKCRFVDDKGDIVFLQPPRTA